MIKIRFFTLLFSLFFLFSGCISLLNKTNVVKDQALSKDSKGQTEPLKPADHDSLINTDKTETVSGQPVPSSNPAAAAVEPSSPEKKIQDLFDEALDYCQVAQDFWEKGELEKAVEALDKAYTLILKINTEDQPGHIQQKENLRFLISKRILEIYASRNITVNGNHKAIPVILNKHIQAEIENYTGRDRQFFIDSYRRSGRYRPMIIPILTEAGLPVELSWLPLIESGFKTLALSKARALGLWQFIPSTGYKFGLMRDTYIDQRLDPVRATHAATAYLKELHQIFGDWTTALASYNCGEGRVLRVIRGQNINYLDNFWDLYEKLPNETARYVPKFLATLHIINNLEKYGFDPLLLDSPIKFETLEVSRQVHLKHIAEKIGTSEESLAELNPELRYRILPPKKYTLKIPAGSNTAFIAKLDEMPITSIPQRKFIYHRVRSGETLSTIARKYRTRVRSIMRINRLRRSNYIYAGQRLKIPRKGYAAVVKHPKKSKKIDYSKKTSHKVKRGDSMWNIAKRYGTTTQKIMDLNHLSSSKLYIGQVLKLQKQTVTPPSVEGMKPYRVKSGDTPFTIARQHSMSLGHFLRINQLTARSKIYPGQLLYVN